MEEFGRGKYGKRGERNRSKHTSKPSKIVSDSSDYMGSARESADTDKFIWTKGIVDGILRMCLTISLLKTNVADFATPSCTYEFYDTIISRNITSWTSMSRKKWPKESRSATEVEKKLLRYILPAAFFHNLSDMMKENRLSKESQSSIEPSTITETRIVSDIEKLSEESQSSTSIETSTTTETGFVSDFEKLSLKTSTTGTQSSSCSATGGSSSVHLSKSESNFLSKTLRIMKPVEAAQPLWSYGFDVKLVENMKSIFMLEGVSMENFVSWEKVEVCEDAVKVAEFLEKLCKDRLATQPDEHFMKTIALSIDEYIGKKDDLWIDEFLKKYTKKNQLIKLFWKKLLATYDFGGLDILNENNLKDFIGNLLSIDEMTCKNEHMLILNPFKYVSKDRIGQKCYTDIECILEMDSENDYFGIAEGKLLRRAFSIAITIEKTSTTGTQSSSCSATGGSSSVHLKASSSSTKCKKKALMQTLCESFGKSCTKTVHIGIRLLWQVLEQCLGNMIEAAYKTEGKTKVFQAGIIVVENKVRNVVLCMDVSSYERICELNNAEDTINWMYRCIKDKMDSWCKVYIDCNEVSITDINRLTRHSCVNFCRAL